MAQALLKVFVSYSRADMIFADRLVVALEARGFEVLIDRRDLPLLEEWQRELLGFIGQADTVVFIVSRRSIASQWVAWELEQVRSLHKRLAPVVIDSVEGLRVPDEIAKINYIFFTDESFFDQRAGELAKALNTDLDWLKEHTRLGGMASRWENFGTPNDQLIRGRDLVEAQAWAARRPLAAPIVSELHQAFLAASRVDELARTARQRRLQRRATWSSGIVALLASTLLVGALWLQRETQRREAQAFTVLAAEALNDEQYDRAMRLALRALPQQRALWWGVGWTDRAMTGLEAKLAGAGLLSRLKAQLTGHTDALYAAALSPDGARVVTASEDDTARIWDASSGRQIAILEGHTKRVRTAVFSPDGTRIVTASLDTTVRVWDAASGKEIVFRTPLRHDADVADASFNLDGTRIVSVSSEDGTARVWDATSGALIAILRGHTDKIRCAAFSPNGALVVTASDDGYAKIWDVASQKVIASLRHGAVVKCAAFSPDGSRVVTVSGGQAGRGDHMARVWDAKSGRETARLEGHENDVFSGEFSPDGRLVLTASLDGTARIWEAEKGEVVAVLSGAHSREVNTAAFNPDGTRVVTASDDGTAVLWALVSSPASRPAWPKIATLKGHEGEVRTASFSRDGKHIVTASYDGTARVWRADAAPLLTVLSGH